MQTVAYAGVPVDTPAGLLAARDRGCGSDRACHSLLECERTHWPGKGRGNRDVVLQRSGGRGSRLCRHTSQPDALADDRYAPRTWRVVPGQSLV